MTARYYVTIEVGPDRWYPVDPADGHGLSYEDAWRKRAQIFREAPIRYSTQAIRTKLLLDLDSVQVENEAEMRELLAHDPVLSAIFKTGVRQGVLQEQRRLRRNLSYSVDPEPALGHALHPAKAGETVTIALTDDGLAELFKAQEDRDA